MCLPNLFNNNEPVVNAARMFSPTSQLAKELRKARIECHQRHTYFVPLDDLKRLITASVIEREILAGNRHVKHTDARMYAKTVERSGRKLFAVLALRKKGAAICSFLENRISDTDLPFLRRDEDLQLSLWRREPKQRIQAFEGYEDEDEEVEEFSRLQWWMIAPVFDKYSRNWLELEDEVILPFIPVKDHEKQNQGIPQQKIGGYSEVTAFRVHPAHHNFWDAYIPLVSSSMLFWSLLLTACRICSLSLPSKSSCPPTK
jgi:hypothetical protein